MTKCSKTQILHLVLTKSVSNCGTCVASLAKEKAKLRFHCNEKHTKMLKNMLPNFQKYKLYQPCLQSNHFSDKVCNPSRTPWSCGLICHGLDRKVEGSNLAAAKNLCQFISTKISSRKSEQNKKGTLSIIASVRAVAVG